VKGLLRKLIEIESTALKGELAAANIIRAELGRSGIDAVIETWNGSRANLAAHIKSAGQKKALLFACHLDVVPAGEAGWTNPAFAAVESDGRIYGRGSADMKGGIAALVTTIRQLTDSDVRLEGDIILLAAAGEESDSCGVKRFVSNFGNKLPELAGVIIPEPTDFDIVTAHRGMLWLEVTTKGKAAHGSTPQLGVNAIASMKAVLDELENYEIQCQPHKLLGESSMSINTISGGKAINIVPDKCSVEIDIRTLPGQNHQDIIEDLEKMFAELKQNVRRVKAEKSSIRRRSIHCTHRGSIGD
jgi:succinyl-diaminopimelate desuccinylase